MLSRDKKRRRRRKTKLLVTPERERERWLKNILSRKYQSVIAGGKKNKKENEGFAVEYKKRQMIAGVVQYIVPSEGLPQPAITQWSPVNGAATGHTVKPKKDILQQYVVVLLRSEIRGIEF